MHQTHAWVHCIKLWYASQIISAIHSSCLLCPFFTIGFAGTAPTVAPAGTSFLTTAPAATIAPSPIWMPPWSWNLQQELINTWGELGKQLLIRGTKGSRKVTLTEEGMLLRKRAEEIFNLVKKRKWDCSLRQCNHRRRVYRRRWDRRYPPAGKGRRRIKKTIPASITTYPAATEHSLPNVSTKCFLILDWYSEHRI